MMENKLEKRLNEIRKECVRINNMLATPLQNGMTTEKERMLKTKLAYLYSEEEKIYKGMMESL